MPGGSFFTLSTLMGADHYAGGFLLYFISVTRAKPVSRTRCLATLLERGHGTGNPRLLIGVPVGRGDARQA